MGDHYVPFRHCDKRRLVVFVLLAFIAGATFYSCTHLPAFSIADTPTIAHAQETVVPPGISHTSFEHGLAQCEALQRPRPVPQPVSERTVNPRGAVNSTLLIKNGYIWLGNEYMDGGDVLIQDGVIREIAMGIEPSRADKVVDAGGRVITPGIIDMHSHMMVDSIGGITAAIDGHEMSGPTKPYVRAIDAMRPTDLAIKVVASGGVTTNLVLPGSANVMGGEAAVVKLRPMPTLSVEDMLVTANATENEFPWRYMKFACGDNAKSFYGKQLKMPMTRMGEAYLFRKRFEEAQELMRQQDDWCDTAMRLNKTMHHDASSPEIQLSEPFPESLKLDSLIALLRHNVKLNIHCYLPQDIEAIVRHSLEFDFDIAALHHASSAWQVPEIIKRAKNNITVATSTDFWGTTVEVWDHNVYAPGILTEAGIPVTLITDHPVTNGRDLVYEAQRAYHYGWDEHLALASVTSAAATALGLDYRIGSIEVGKDADLVIWERHPLRLGARPKHVIVDGFELDFNASWFKGVVQEEFAEKDETQEEGSSSPIDVNDVHALPNRPTNALSLESHDANHPSLLKEACHPNTESFVLRNISKLYAAPGEVYTGAVDLVVEDGHVKCVGTTCEQAEWPSSAPIFQMHGGVVTPGIISSGVSMGLSEMINEPGTQDGFARNNIDDPDLSTSIVRAVDGLQFNGLHMRKAFKAGVTTSITQPMAAGDQMLAGVSVAFRTGIKHTLLDSNDTYVKTETALHFVITHGSSMTISQQMAALRSLLQDNEDKDAATNIFARAAQGQLAVVVETDDADEIASIINMKQHALPKVKFIILGGAESHLVASHLARVQIPVILMPARCVPLSWQARRCLYGPPYSKDTAIDILLRHGVLVGLASEDRKDGSARNLIWEAGWNLAHNKDMTQEMAVGLVTWNIAQMFGLDEQVGMIRQGYKADFIAYNGNPFEFGTTIDMVYGGGHPGPLCSPRQT
ncbi:hypothetical protein O0I10_004176 [Lichtheimia ornata]|uniref:Amidohydrolase-related domain-containing protein n=1 Tax=Lichtheimia ornata TaxID=688661 RepID=A0AAD7V6X5_9FUNG|nr:uncharacterized protein O0I10_004176 [Lichtheimia ornata]KAJ8659950.1 hypothetical protein O0I10_004176 [Lichtheimia ornata]